MWLRIIIIFFSLCFSQMIFAQESNQNCVISSSYNFKNKNIEFAFEHPKNANFYDYNIVVKNISKEEYQELEIFLKKENICLNKFLDNFIVEIKSDISFVIRGNEIKWSNKQLYVNNENVSQQEKEVKIYESGIVEFKKTTIRKVYYSFQLKNLLFLKSHLFFILYLNVFFLLINIIFIKIGYRKKIFQWNLIGYNMLNFNILYFFMFLLVFLIFSYKVSLGYNNYPYFD